MTVNWRSLETEISELLKSYGCALESDNGEIWLVELPLNGFDCDDENISTAPVNISDLARELEQRVTTRLETVRRLQQKLD